MIKKKKLQFTYMNFVEVDIELRSLRTVLNGKSATGKSYFYNMIEQYSQEEKRSDILCLNMGTVDLDDVECVISRLQKIDDGVIVIDQADNILTNKKLYDYIFLDDKNYYILISRKFYERYSELARLRVTANSIKLEYQMNTI